MSQDKVRVAVVGLGMGMYHLECYHKNPKTEVVAVCDLNEVYARKTAEKFGVPSVTTDYKELLDNKDVDAVSIATPVFLHRPMAEDFLNAGKHVLVEKPMSDTLENAQAMAKAAKKSGKVLTVHHNQRYDRSTQFIKGVLDSNQLGNVYFIRAGWRRNMSIMVTPTVEREGEIFDKSWFMRKDKGGGVLFDLGTHIIDRIMYLLGFPEVSRVMCATYNKLGKIEESKHGYKFDAEDLATGLVQFKNGLSLDLEVAFGSYVEPKQLMYADFYGSEAGLSDKNGSIKIIESCGGAMKIASMDSLPEPKIATPVDDFIAALSEGRKPLITMEESISVMAVLDALRKSADSVAWVP